MTSLTPSLGGSSAATAVNEAGAIVGSVPTLNGGTQAVVWSGPGYTAQFLTSPPGWSSVRAIDIDENGVALGAASNPGGPVGTIVWAGGTPTEVPISLPGGYTWYSPAARNTRGQIVGKASTYGWSPFTGWLYDNGRIYDLNVYMPSGYSAFSVDDINEAGDITGTMYLPASGTGRRPLLLKVSDLVRYLPEYRFSIQEPYRPAAAGLATDAYTPSETHENTNLFKVDGVPVAAADPARALAQLSLNYLGSLTPSGLIENIDEASYYGSQSTSSLFDYQSMLQRFPGVYSDRIYGRVVTGASGEKLLQYWAYYYYNQKTYICCGEHEGDWELVQVRLSAAGTPMSASYAQHGSPERCLWTDVEKSTTGQPVVWVADGSHASYFWAGSHALPGMQVDTTGTESSFFSTVIQLEDVTSTPTWLLWDGYWGSSVSGSLAPSPRSPGVQAAWDAFAWEPGVDCTERPSAISPATEPVTALSRHWVAGGLASSVIAPPVPRCTAMIFGKAVRIAYCFDRLPSGPRRRPWQVFVSLDNPYDALPPATLGWPVTGRCGRINHPRGVVRRPYIVRLSVRSKYGNQSRIIQRALA